MSDLNVKGMAVAPSVVETIVSIAVKDIEGVAGFTATQQKGLMNLLGKSKRAPQSIQVELDENEALRIGVRLSVYYGYVLPELAVRVRNSIADAVSSQVGAEVSAVDVYIDSVVFAR